MNEIINKITKVEIENSSLAVTKGYEYTTKDGKKRYSYCDIYYEEDGKIKRKHSNDSGDFYYNIELVDIVIETFPLKDGNIGSKSYPLSEVPYLAQDAESADAAVLENYLKFKLHR